VLIGRLIVILIQFLEYKSGWSVRSIFVKDPVYDNIKDRNENKMGENTTPSKQLIELELNDTSDTLMSTSYLDLQFEICFV
jgi:hypothetical protein